jgi:hypothetical protein
MVREERDLVTGALAAALGGTVLGGTAPVPPEALRELTAALRVPVQQIPSSAAVVVVETPMLV